MKATCNREGLLTAFQVASVVVPARTPKNILKSVKLELSNDHAVLSATDLELGIRYHISGVQVHEPGQLVLPAAQVNSILRELPDETIELEETESGIKLSGASSYFELPSQDVMQFPDIPDFDEEDVPTIKSGDFVTMIRRTVFAVAPENSRYALNSVLIEFEENGVAKMVATDGKRLSLMPGKADLKGAPPKGGYLLHPKALQLLQRTLQDPEEDVKISLRDNEALFRTGKVTLYSRLVEGRFPRYQDVFPPPAAIHVPLVVGNLHSVVRQAKIVTSEQSKGVLFQFSDGVLMLSSRAADVGQSEVRMPVSYDGETLQVTFDPQLLIDALRVMDPDEEVTMDLVDTRKAAVFRTKDHFEYVIMPLTKEKQQRQPAAADGQ